VRARVSSAVHHKVVERKRGGRAEVSDMPRRVGV